MNGIPVVSYDNEKTVNDPFYYYKRVLLYSLIIAATITIPFVLVEVIKTGKPIFLYYGDYNAQQICFYEHAVDMVRHGNFFWDWYTDLGSNFMGSYSYYMLGSPFFWIMCLFPASWAPYLMAPMFILKYITAALFSYAYLKRFVKNQNYAIIGALLYTFCGFQIYNTFFNQFHEVVALFPLLLLGMEELIQNNRKGLFAIAVALNAMCNYFMFAGQIVFCIIYFLARFSQRSFKVTWKKFGLLAFEAVLGALMAMIIFLPAALGVLSNPRVDSYYGINLDAIIWRDSGQLYWQRYGHIISSYFFPPDIPSRVNFFFGHETRWSSVAAYVPMFGVSGVFAFFAAKKRTWLKFTIIFLMVCSVVPVLNSMFYIFNTSYYARWFYMMIIMLVLATIIMLDDDSESNDKKWRGGIIAYLIGTAAFFIPLGLLWYHNPENPTDLYQLGRAVFVWRFWIYTGIALVSIWILWYLFTKLRHTPAFEKTCLIAVSAIIIVYSAVHITNGKQHSYSSDFMINRTIDGEVNLDITENNFSRIDFYRDANVSPFDNLGIYWGYPSIECFHTVVPASIMEFYPMIGISRTVGSRAETKYYGLRGFTSVKYMLIDTKRTPTTQPDEYTFLNTQNGYDIYTNNNFIQMGFAYKEFMIQSQFEKVAKSTRHALLCTYLVVPDEEADYYRQFMTEVKYNGTGYKSANYTTYTASVAERREMASESFSYNSNGFTSTIRLDSPNVVFFSVPYDDGWSVTVDGIKKDVLKATYGFMAVECRAGLNNIEFTYRAPGMYAGIIITGVSVVIFGGYLYFFRRKKDKATYRFFKEDYYDVDDAEVIAESKIDVDNIENEAFFDMGVTPGPGNSAPEETPPSEEPVDNTDTEQNETDSDNN